MCPSDDGEQYVLDSCVVIDFCGRTDNLAHLMAHVGEAAVITSAVQEELERNRRKRFPRLAEFLDLVDRGVVEIADPEMTNETAARILAKWSRCFGEGEVSSAALAASRGWIFVSQDLEPMRMLRLSETLAMQTTGDVLASLARRRVISDQEATRIQRSILQASRRRKG